MGKYHIKEVSRCHKCGATAVDAHTELNIDDILEKLTNIEEIVESNLETLNKKIISQAEGITKDVLSVDGTGIDKLISDYEGNTSGNVKSIKTIISNAKEEAVGLFNDIQDKNNNSFNSSHVCHKPKNDGIKKAIEKNR